MKTVQCLDIYNTYFFYLNHKEIFDKGLVLQEKKVLNFVPKKKKII